MSATAFSRSDVGKNAINGMNRSRDGSHRYSDNLLTGKFVNGSSLNHLEDGEVSQRNQAKNHAGSTRPTNGTSNSARQQEDNNDYRSRTHFRGSLNARRFESRQNDTRWRSERDNVGNRSRDSSSVRSKNESRHPQSCRNGLNRHELNSWKRIPQLSQQTSRKNDNPAAVARTGSSMSKKSVSSNHTSKSSPTCDSSVRGKRFIKEDVDSEKSSKTTSSSRTDSGSGTENPSKRRKLNISPLSKVKSSELRKSATPKPENNGHVLSQPEQSVMVHGDWTIHSSKGSGRPYYFNTKTKVSQWHKPDEIVAVESDVPMEANKFETKPKDKSPSPVPGTPAPKRKASAIESQTSQLPLKLPVRMESALLGSPISDDDELSVASPTRSEQMEISDNISNASVAPSKTAASISTRTSPSRVTKISPKEKFREMSPPSAKRKTKAPTLENMKTLHGADDPDKRRTEKFERVATWMSTLEPAGGTPSDFTRSPGITDPGSPVSSSESECSEKANLGGSASTVDLSQLSHPPITNSLKMPWRNHVEISLPVFDFPDFSETGNSEATNILDFTLSGQFRSLKIDSLEEQRCKISAEARSRAYAVAGEKSIAAKSSVWDASQKTITMMFQTEDICFLAGLEEDLSKTMHPRVDQKQDFQKVHIKSELTESELKTEPESVVDSKLILASCGNSFSKAATLS